MKTEVEALKFVPGDKREPPSLELLPVAGADAISGLRNQQLPVAYLLKNSESDLVTDFHDDVICIREEKGKNAHIGLSHYLLARDKIPFIEGTYVGYAHVPTSVRRLLENAVNRPEKNVYLIGIKDEIFDELKEKKCGKERPGSAPPVVAGASALPGSLEDDWQECPEWLDKDEAEKWLGRFWGVSKQARNVRRLTAMAARGNLPVLIVGDSGTGKEAIARAVHELNPDAKGRFVAVNCAAIPGDLFESELFGHVRGAFTHAMAAKKGWVEVARGGTLFLDEVGDLAPQHQGKLLRWIENDDGEYWPIGAERPRRAKARVVAATNRELYEMVGKGEFREDLFWRLRKFMIRTPALTEAPEDLRLIANRLWKEQIARGVPPLSEDVLKVLGSHRWIGNVRELKGTLEFARMLVSDGDSIGPEHLRWIWDQDRPGRRKGATVRQCEVSQHDNECLRHLRRVDEAARALKIALREFSLGDLGAAIVEQAISELPLRMEELEDVCRTPLLFHSESAYSATATLKGKLAQVLDLLRSDPRAGHRYWQDDVRPHYRQLRAILFAEVERLDAE